MRAIFREANDREITENNPAKSIKCPKVVVKPAKFLTWEELKEIDFGRQTQRIRFLALHGLPTSITAATIFFHIHSGISNKPEHPNPANHSLKEL